MISSTALAVLATSLCSVRVSLASLESIVHECRAFCHGVEFDFPHKLMRVKCLKLAAPLRPRKILRVKNKC